jgi:hypothetical protein
VAHIARQYPVWGRFSNVPRASGVSIDADQERAIDFVQAHVQPDELIYVGTLAHDRGSISDASFYFLCERPCPTFYGQLHPGITSTAPVQQHMRDEIASSDVQWIVLVRMPDLMEPNQSSVSSGVDVLDAFIRSNYRGVGEFGSYKVLKRVAEGTQHESQSVNVGTQRTD